MIRECAFFLPLYLFRIASISIRYYRQDDPPIPCVDPCHTRYSLLSLYLRLIVVMPPRLCHNTADVCTHFAYLD